MAGFAFKIFISTFIIFTIYLSLYLQYKSIKEHFLIIAIFSHPANFQQRMNARKTWLKFVNEDVKYVFILGDSVCNIPPDERTTAYSCERRKSATSAQSPEIVRNICSTGFTFAADYDLKITHLGIPPSLKFDSPVRVKLKDGYDQRTLASVTFADSQNGHVKAISPAVHFPRYSEGLLTIESSNLPPTTACFSPETDYAFRETNLVVEKIFTPLEKVKLRHIGVIPFFKYIILEQPTEDSAETKWKKSMDALYEDIEDEMEKHRDIFLVNTPDFYQNLPNKLIHFIKHIDGFTFKYLLKTDDDSFLDLPRILAELRDPDYVSEKIWCWSYWRKFWHVPLTGKWRETKYQSSTYPPFPCGGGYVLNRAAVRHLASIADKLTFFQGEDVSLGIWLSGVDMVQYQGEEDKERTVSYSMMMGGKCERGCYWTCGGETNTTHPLCNLVNVPEDTFDELWKKFKNEGRL